MTISRYYAGLLGNPCNSRVDFIASALGRGKHRIDEAFRFIDRTLIAKGVGKINEHIVQHLVATPVLKATMHGFVVRITLRQHVPLGTGVENPEDGVDEVSGGDWLAARSTGWNMFLRKMLPDAFPLIIG